MLLHKSLTLTLHPSSCDLPPPPPLSLPSLCGHFLPPAQGQGPRNRGWGQGLAQTTISLAISHGKMDSLFQSELAREIELEREGGREGEKTISSDICT